MSKINVTNYEPPDFSVFSKLGFKWEPHPIVDKWRYWTLPSGWRVVQGENDEYEIIDSRFNVQAKYYKKFGENKTTFTIVLKGYSKPEYA